MPVRPLRVGLIVPSSNTVMEPDFHGYFGRPSVISTTRIFLENVTRDAETRMLQDGLPAAIELIATTAPDVVVFGCTSAGALGNLAGDHAIADMIQKRLGAQTVTALGAVLAQLRTMATRRVAVFTPYVEELTNCVASCVVEAGFSLQKALGMGIRNNLEIGAIAPEQIVHFVESQMAEAERRAVDCLFLSCTNWRAIGAVEPLQRKFGIPVVTSNQAAIYAAGLVTVDPSAVAAL